MKYNPFVDQKFWTLVVDAFATVATFVFANYFPAQADLFKLIWGVCQPIVALLIANMFIADAIAIRSEDMKFPRHFRS